jgi:hypothetical protein
MAELTMPARDSVAAQREMFRRAQAEEGLSLAVLHQRDKHLRLSTLRSWATGGTAMPAWAIGALGEAGIPDHLLSLVAEPFGRGVFTTEDGEGDLDTAADEATEFAQLVQRARHPRSPGGVAIVPQEAAVIHPQRQKAQAALQRAA